MENLIDNKKTILITRTFSHPVSAVWKAWSEPESLKKWFSPEGYSAPSSTIDFKVGGKFLSSMRSPDGKITWSTGTYKEIIPQQKIGYSDSFADSDGNIVPASYYDMPGDWGLQTEVTVTFEDEGGKTNMTLQHAGLPVEAADDCVKGWNSCFDKLERNIE